MLDLKNKTKYSEQHPKIWDKTSSAAANFIALQAYMHKPASQVDEARILDLIDQIILPLLEAKNLIDPVPPEIKAKSAPINHSEILKSLP